MFALFAFAGSVAGVFSVNFVCSRNVPSENACVNNLRQIDGAKQTWALENHKGSNELVSLDQIQPYLGRGTAGALPHCPQEGTYTLGHVGETPRCSIEGHHLD